MDGRRDQASSVGSCGLESASHAAGQAGVRGLCVKRLNTFDRTPGCTLSVRRTRSAEGTARVPDLPRPGPGLPMPATRRSCRGGNGDARVRSPRPSRPITGDRRWDERLVWFVLKHRRVPVPRGRRAKARCHAFVPSLERRRFSHGRQLRPVHFDRLLCLPSGGSDCGARPGGARHRRNGAHVRRRDRAHWQGASAA